jgi:alpha-D-ribose 1-methylphosphonate 5-triphosphate synthase subunit PhnG
VTTATGPNLDRRRWMSVLALASTEELAAYWPATVPRFRRLRGPEIGLAMVRARAGGTGVRFNLGEITVTRCAVQLADGTVGHAWVGGRRPEHAERAAVLDGLLQQPARRVELEAAIIEPLERAQAARRRAVVARSASSRVEFFTMVRGEDR